METPKEPAILFRAAFFSNFFVTIASFLMKKRLFRWFLIEPSC